MSKKLSQSESNNNTVDSKDSKVLDTSADNLLSVATVLDSEDNPYFSDMSGYTDVALSKKEMSLGTKSCQPGGYDIYDENGKRYDAVPSKILGDGELAVLNGTISSIDSNTNHYDGILGTFDYDTNEWAICKKTVTDASTGQESEIPVLRYIGTETAGNKIEIPDGVRVLDYAFEGNTALTTVPVIPESVESAHASFMDCKNITRACKDSKEGEHQGISDTLIGLGAGAASGAAGGAVGGAVVGGGIFSGATAVGGAIGGAVVGLAGGVYGIVKGTETDGKGGTWKMPKNLKDASYMFAGCENLTEAYKSAGDSLLLARGMYKDNANIGLDSYATKNGSVALTDFTDSMLSKEAVQDSYTGTNVAITDDLTGNYSKNWNDDLGKIEDISLTDDEKINIEGLSDKLKVEDVKNGVVETQMAADTDGLAFYAKKRTKTGVTTTYDVTDKNEGVQDVASDSGNMGSLLDRGIISLAEFSVLKLVTGNALLSAGITFGGQMLGILPKSVKPVLSMVAGFVGTDGPVGKALSSIVDKLPDSEDSAITVQAASNEDNESYASRRIKGSVSDYLKVSTGDYTCDITSMMNGNGRSVASDGTFLSIGEKGPDSDELKEMSSIAVVTGGALEERAISLAGDDNMLSDENKQKLSDNVMNLMSGLEAYNTSAYSMIDAKYGIGSNKGDQAHAGLGYTMDVMVEPLKTTIMELNDQYDFLLEDDLLKLDGMQISDAKVCSKVGNGSFQKGADMAEDVKMFSDVKIDGEVLNLDEDKSSNKGQIVTKLDSKSSKNPRREISEIFVSDNEGEADLSL